MFCVITCSDFYPLSNKMNLFIVINIRGIINIVVTCIMTSFRFILEDKVSSQLMKLYFYIVNLADGVKYFNIVL